MIKKCVKVIAGILVFCMLFSLVSSIVQGGSNGDKIRIKQFYQLKPKTLDAVYVGASTTYAYWMAPYAWAEYGIAVYPYAVAGQAFSAMTYCVDEVKKTQPNALILLDLNTIVREETVVRLHRLTDCMPASFLKIKMIYETAKRYDFTIDDTIGCFVPLYLYHSRWDELNGGDFQAKTDKYMSGQHYSSYLKTVESFEAVPLDQKCRKLSDDQLKSLQEIVDCCEGATVLFVVAPQAKRSGKRIQMINAAEKWLIDHNQSVLDLRTWIDEIGIDYSQDFYNEAHTNMHGSIKVTSFLAQYLIENYGFQDKRGDIQYFDWDKGWENYYADFLEKSLKDSDLDYFTQPIYMADK